MAIMEDVRGDKAHVRIFNYVSPALDHSTPMSSLFYPQNTMVLVEPWVGSTTKVGGEKEVHIFNPSHFIMLHDAHPFLVKLGWHQSNYCKWLLTLGSEKSRDHKKEGNEHFKSGKYWAAAECYTKSMVSNTGLDPSDMHGNTPFRQKMTLALSNRSEAFLQAQHYHLALSDAKSALLIDRTHVKSISRLARARLGLCDYRHALQDVEQGLSLAPDNAGLRQLQEQLARRANTLHCSEQINIKGMLADSQQTGTRGEVRITWPDYHGPFEVREATVCEGRGLFATRSLALGEVIMAEKAVCAVYPFELSPARVELPDDVSQLMLSGSRCITELVWRLAVTAACTLDCNNAIERLYSGSSHAITARRKKKKKKESGAQRDGAGPEPPDDITHRRDDIIEKYGVDVGHVEQLMMLGYTFNLETMQIHRSDLDRSHPKPVPGHGSGLFNNCSLMNHSCMPNCRRFAIGDVMFVSVIQPIKAGVELTMAYQDKEYLTSRHRVLDGKGFVCACLRCKAEAPSDTTYSTLKARYEGHRQHKHTDLDSRNALMLYEDLTKLLHEIDKLTPQAGELASKTLRLRRRLQIKFQMEDEQLITAQKSVHALQWNSMGHWAPNMVCVKRILRFVDDLKAAGQLEKAREWRSQALDMARALLGDSDYLVSYLFQIDI